MDIKEDKLRNKLKAVLQSKSRNQVVKEIQATGKSFHQYHIDKFMLGKDVKLSTLKKLDKYLNGS